MRPLHTGPEIYPGGNHAQVTCSAVELPLKRGFLFCPDHYVQAAYRIDIFTGGDFSRRCFIDQGYCVFLFR